MESEPSTSTYTSTAQWLQPCRKFELHEILLATDNFNESFVIGSGGFGKVYKAEVIVGTSHVVAAIKRLDLMSDQGAAEFWAEVEMLSKLRHSHLVSLIGYCNYEREMILVYEYMPNGTLEDHLHKLRTPLSWVDRLKICIGSARGLDYLHTGTSIQFGVIHRDVKSSNILLHESWAAKISDFGLSRIGPTNQPLTYVNTLVKGTFGYLDPNYFATGKLTRKSDVYAFGVVLFEVLCQKRPLDRSLEWGLATWAQDSIKEGNLKNIVDSDMKGEISPKCLKGFARIAERCLDNHPKRRPTMTEVIFGLESVLTLQQKTNNWLQTPGKSIFTRMVQVFPFSSTGENPGIIDGDHPVIIDGGNKSFSLDNLSGKKCYMLAARDLSIAWGDTPTYWRWISFPESRFAEVAELIKVCWLEVHGTINTSMLSIDTRYAAYFVYKLTPNTYGFEDYPAEVYIGLSGVKSQTMGQTKTVYLDPTVRDEHEQQRGRRMGTSGRIRNKSDAGSPLNGPKPRQDGWLEIELGEFLNRKGQEGELKMTTKEVKGRNWKGGLIVQGIEIRPKASYDGSCTVTL